MVTNPLQKLEDMFANVDNDRIQRAARGFLLAAFVLLSILPFFVSDWGVLRLILLSFIWAGYATAWNLFSGYSGYISFGHAIFFGLGGFVSTVLLVEQSITPWIGMVVGGITAVVAALIIGAITFQSGLSGIYFALSILAFPLIAAPVIIWLGYIEISVPLNTDAAYQMMSFRGLFEYYYIALGLLLLTLGVSWWVQRNRLGFYLQAINSSEEAAESLGVNTYRCKLYAFSLSAFLSGLLGTIYIQVNYIFYTEGVFSVTTSAEPVILAVAGGLGTLFGPLVAGLTLFPLAEFLRSTLGSTIPGIHNILYGIVLIFVIIYFPDGLYAGLRKRVMTDAQQVESDEQDETVDHSETAPVED